MANIKKSFTIEQQYQQYLSLVGLSEEDMHPVQKIETRRAFYAGCGQLLYILRDGVSKLSEDEAVQKMEDLLQEVQDFWKKEAEETNQN